MFKAGAAEIDITPKLGTLINGEFTCRYANKIADRLHARALVLNNNEETVLFILVDICVMQRDFVDAIKSEIEKELNIPAEKQMIAATHSHSTGSVAELLLCHVDWAYRNWLPKQIIKVAKSAYSKLKTAIIGWGSCEKPEHMLCRRYKMTHDYIPMNPVTGEADQLKTNPFGVEKYIIGPTTTPDPELRYLVIKGTDGTWISLLANYCLHYVGDCDRGTISSDYFGYFSQYIKEKLAADNNFVGMMSNGTSGEINSWYFQGQSPYPKENHEKSKYIALDLAKEVEKSLQNVIWEENPILKSAFEDIVVNYRKPTRAEILKAESIIEKTDYENISFGEPQFFNQVYAREQVLLSEFPDSKNFAIQSFQIGSGKIGGLGGEFFTETGLQIKKAQENSHYFTVCFANDYVGYVPPKHELEKGGYETWRCRSSCLASDSEEKIKKSLLNQLNHYG